MSVASQFFPSVGGAEGFIDLETFIVSGGGGGGSQGVSGSSNYYAGGGGGGAVFYGYISIKPGSTCPIVVGAGGAGGVGSPSPGFGNPGLNGSDSSITTPVTTITVAGGGGGGNAFSNGPGLTGGTGGGAGGQQISPFASGVAGKSIYYSGGSVFSSPIEASTQNNNKGSNVGGNVSSNKYGTFHGYPGSTLATYFVSPGYSPLPGSSQGGGAGGSGGSMTYSNWFSSNIAGISSDYGFGGWQPAAPITPPGSIGANLGNGGNGAPGAPVSPTGTSGSSGSSGVVILKYPTQFAAAPAFPGATDLSPSTPGFRTYRFTSPGSITLP